MFLVQSVIYNEFMQSFHPAKSFLLVCSIFLTASAPLRADPAVTIEGGWVRAVPPGYVNTAAYLTIKNPGASTVRVTGATATVAESVGPMITTEKKVNGQTVMGMEFVKELTIPAKGQLVLEPGGDHLMLMGLKKRLNEGDKVTLILNIEPGASRLEITLPVSRQQPAR